MSEDETTRIQSVSFCALSGFCRVKFQTFVGCCRQCLCIIYGKCLMIQTSDENGQVSACSRHDTRDVGSISKPVFQSSTVSAPVRPGLFIRVRGAETDFLVWSSSMPQSVIYLQMKGASAVVKSTIAD